MIKLKTPDGPPEITKEATAPSYLGFGDRLLRARTKAKMTQKGLAKLLGGDTHSRVSLWEAGHNFPDMKTIEEIAGLLSIHPEWLAYGVSQEANVVAPNPQQLGYVLTPEIQFGDSMDDVTTTQTWGLAYNWLRTEMNVKEPEKVCLFRAENSTDTYSVGDRLVVDRSSTRLSPAGAFVIWDGVAAIVANVAMVPPKGNRIMARVSTGDMNYEADVDKLNVIGRVITIWKKA